MRIPNMKDQYVGDIKDFEKYALLRRLAAGSGLPLAVCWMLTDPDGSTDGNLLQYLEDRGRYRHLDPHVFDLLRAIIDADDRRVAAVERSGVLEERTTFFDRRLENRLNSRFVYFRGVWETLSQPTLVFFDPDKGLASPKMRRSAGKAAAYVFEEELTEGYRKGHSLVVFHHWGRIQRLEFLEGAFSRLCRATGSSSVFAVWSRARVAFLAVPQGAHAAGLRAAARSFAADWPDVSYTDESTLSLLP
jgi:hypothetical protein